MKKFFKTILTLLCYLILPKVIILVLALFIGLIFSNNFTGFFASIFFKEGISPLLIYGVGYYVAYNVSDKINTQTPRVHLLSTFISGIIMGLSHSIFLVYNIIDKGNCIANIATIIMSVFYIIIGSDFFKKSS